MVPWASAPILCFALPDTFSAVRKASGPGFLFCAPRLIFGSSEGVVSHFHALRSLRRFGRYQGRRAMFSCFAPTGLIFSGTEGVGSRFHVLRPCTRFRLFQARLVPFSCFALFRHVFGGNEGEYLVFMFCAPKLVFDGTGGVRSRFHVLRSRTRYRRRGGRRVPFSCFALPESFSAVPRVSGSVSMLCSHGHLFGSTMGVGCCFHVLRPHTHFRQVPFSCIAFPYSFSAVARASGSVFKFCAHGHVFSSREGVGSCFHVLCPRTHFRR
jgi:hypothetical protein